ncbi:hypothetical protein DFR86_11825 [Acidianus sulfidivorans JP7]|uniref:hypothetical protein n=1 Tax=Acidianus sulfidivorans TaxID=312539 RepID=UPI0013A551C6|nr:hypothetical protein [Acidianus sulfidivorans]QIJ32886.1 hypothetical protein DFR86_11825 [Acidianus sulfidivorans JP7]
MSSYRYGSSYCHRSVFGLRVVDAVITNNKLFESRIQNTEDLRIPLSSASIFDFYDNTILQSAKRAMRLWRTCPIGRYWAGR